LYNNLERQTEGDPSIEQLGETSEMISVYGIAWREKLKVSFSELLNGNCAAIGQFQHMDNPSYVMPFTLRSWPIAYRCVLFALQNKL
jgi:hypothetical protein